MPEVIVYAMSGRSLDQRRGLVRDITEAVVRNYGTTADQVTVQIVECDPSQKSKGGVLYSDRAANPT